MENLEQNGCGGRIEAAIHLHNSGWKSWKWISAFDIGQPVHLDSQQQLE
jgi:hypothetical protein